MPVWEPPREFSVLHVEQEAGLASQLQKGLKGCLGISFIFRDARSLADAARCLAEAPADVCFLNLSLPECFGVESCARVKKLAPQLPVVVFVDQVNEQIGVHAVREGAHDFVVKETIEFDLLARSLQRAVERNRIETAISQLLRALPRADDRQLVQSWMDGVVHDLNNYLTIIDGRAHLIERTRRGHVEAEHAREIQKAVEKTAALSRRLQKFGSRG